jgi:chorismate synthase
MVMLVIADAIVEKFGGDSLAEIQRNLRSYLESIPDVIAPGPSVP